MVILDTTVVNVAFPTLRQEFGSGIAQTQWIISIYVLALGISTPLAGFLSDRSGIKRMYIAGLVIFLAGSILSGLAPTLPWLVAARALQGIGGGLAMPLGTALLFRTFPTEEQGTALGIFGIALVVAPALGPLLGGWLVDHGHWRWIFFINVPIGLFGVALASRFLRALPGRGKTPVDGLGLVTEVIGFGAILYAASIAAQHGWSSPEVVLTMLIGITGLVWFAFIELFHAKVPLLDLRLFRKRLFLSASLVGWVSVMALFGAEFLLPLYLQSLRGYTAFQTGLILLPLALAAGVTLPIAGRLYDKIGPRPLLLVGFGLLVVNTSQLIRLEADTSITWIMGLLLLRGLALGLTVQSTFVAALSVVPMQEIARGSSLTNATRQVVQAIGVAILATVLVSTLSTPMRAAAEAARAGAVETGFTGGLCGSPANGPQSALMAEACVESLAGFAKAYGLTMVFAVLALILGSTLPGWPMAWHGRVMNAPPVPG